MPVQHGYQFIVLNVSQSTSQVSLTQKSLVGEQLPQPHVGRKLRNFGKHC